jgi:hypothetical protein
MRGPRLGSGLLALCLLCLSPHPVLAYVGPGSALSAVGAILALIAGILFAIFGFVWYPIKRIMRAFRKTGSANQLELGEDGGRRE